MLSHDNEIEQLVDIVQQLIRESGDIQNFDARNWLRTWLQAPVPALGWSTPLEVLDRPGGFDRVRTLLLRIQSGAYS